MKLIKRNYKKIYQETFKVDEHLIVDLFASLFNASTLKENFKNNIYGEINDQNYMQFLGHFIKMVFNKEKNWESILGKVISYNESYIESFGYQKLSDADLKDIFDKDMCPSLHYQGLTPDMMLMYYFGKNIFMSEKVNFLKEQYKEYSQKIAQKSFSNSKKDVAEVFENFELYSYLEERDLENLDTVNWQEIGKQFKCQYLSDTKTYTNVKRGLLLFLHAKLNEFSEIKNNVISKTDAIIAIANKAVAFADNQARFVKELFALREENNNLKIKVKKLSKQLKEIEKTKQTVKIESNTEKDKQILELTKQNSFLLSRIESLENQISLLEEAKQINQTIQENVIIEEKVTDITPQIFEYMDICVLGGSWNSKTKEELQNALPTCNIEFIESEKTLSKIDRIANADVVIFDTSRNAHAYYYKVKQFANKVLHINKSKAEEVVKLAGKIS